MRFLSGVIEHFFVCRVNFQCLTILHFRLEISHYRDYGCNIKMQAEVIRVMLKFDTIFRPFYHLSSTYYLIKSFHLPL